MQAALVAFAFSRFPSETPRIGLGSPIHSIACISDGLWPRNFAAMAASEWGDACGEKVKDDLARFCMRNSKRQPVLNPTSADALMTSSL